MATLAQRAEARARRLGLRGPQVRPWVLPGAPLVHELRWRARLAAARPVDLDRYGATLRLHEREVLLPCHLCGATRVKPLFHVRDTERGRWEYRVVRCPDCGLLYRNPGIRPERLGDLYAGDAYGRFLTGHYGGRRRMRRYRLVMRAFRPLFARGDGRRLLDYGCGAGLFLRIADRRGFEPYGVDLSPAAIEIARQHPSGRNAHLGAPEDIPEIAAGGFDVITLWSVLAHLAEPVADLRRLRALLKPDGVLLILTVNVNSLGLKARGARWNGFTANHLAFFDPVTLARLTREAGFGAVDVKPMYGDGVERGTSPLSKAEQRRLRRAIDRGNRGNMMRAVAYADPDGPARARARTR
ncbi:MAG TPA: class I SAM-dependent methyltransferase [Capillimicrobium sp.]|nr:class I SAM-dependent methyltransferase [Capillimicrobium sp.]